MQRTTKGPLTGVALVVAACIALPFGSAFAVQLFPSLGTWGVTALRISIAALVVLLAVRPKIRHWNRSQWVAVTWFGISLAAMNGAFYASIERIPMGTAVAIEFLGPLVLAAALTRRLVDAVWVCVAVVGIALLGLDGVIGTEPLDLVGVMFALIAGGFWAMYIRMSARVGSLVPGAGGLAIALLVAAVILLPFGVPAAMGLVADPQLIWLAVITAVLASVIPYTFELAALRRIPERVFGVLVSLEPAFATLAGFLILSQGIAPLRVAAVVLVIVASVGITSAARPKRHEPAGPLTGTIAVIPD